MATNCVRSKLANIKKSCETGGNSAGIVTELFVAPKEEVETIPAIDAATGLIDGEIVMVDDTRTAAEVTAGEPAEAVPGTFRQIDLSEVELGYTTEEVGEAEDGNINHIITGFLPKMSPAKNVILESLRGGRECIVKFTDRNRYPWLIGDTDEGMTFVITPTSSPRNGYSIRGTAVGAKLLPSYTGALSVEA
jgi:hypothetical protein